MDQARESTFLGSMQNQETRILLSGYLGDHEIAILSQREGFQISRGRLKSDCAPLNDLVGKMLDACPSIRCMRDPTRGGLATTLNEIASMSNVGMVIEEEKIPVRESVRGICELLGLDPLYLANEGKLIAICPPDEAEPCIGGHERSSSGKRGRNHRKGD